MLDLAKNFALQKVQNSPPLVGWMVVCIWLLLLAVGVASVLSRTEKSGFWKIAWLTVLIAMPWFGLLLYSVMSAIGSDLSFLKPFGVRKASRIVRN